MSCSKDQVCESVETFKQCCLSAPGRTEDRKDLPRVDVEVNVAEGLKCFVVEAEILDVNFLRHKPPIRFDGEHTDSAIHELLY